MKIFVKEEVFTHWRYGESILAYTWFGLNLDVLLQCHEDLCDGRNVHSVRYGEFILVYTWSGLNSGMLLLQCHEDLCDGRNVHHGIRVLRMACLIAIL